MLSSNATVCLMNSCAPAWVARQPGHKNSEMVYGIHARWIDGADKSRERDRLDAALTGPLFPRNFHERPGKLSH